MSVQLPLDLVSTTTCYGAFAAYRVSTSYTGPTVTIRRDSDNTALDFYANANGQMGTAVNGTGTTLESWLNGATGYVTKWWDQSGKGNHATQATTAQQPRMDLLNARLDFTTGSGTAYFSLPNGTVPLGKPYSTTWGYISTSSGSRTELIPSADNNPHIEHLYEAVLTSTAYMNGTYIGANQACTYMNGSRSALVNNEFSVVYGFFDGTYRKSARVVFRKNGNVIDVYQSQGLYWTGNVTEYNVATISDPNVTTGSGGYGVVQVTIQCNTPYTVTMHHHTLGSTTSAWLGAGGNGAATNQVNNFRRNNTTYSNDWYSNDFVGNASIYTEGNTVTFAFDGSYNYFYVNGTPQGVSPVRSGWNAPIGNEFIGRGNYGNYINGEMYSLYIFKSYLDTNERLHIESTMPVANAPSGIKFSQIKAACGVTTTTLTLSQANSMTGTPAGSSLTLSTMDGFILRPGLFTRIYWSRYHNNDPTWFNANSPNLMCITTNLRNTYCATGGFNNPNTVDTAIGGLAAATTYSVEWTGLFYAPTTGTYTFYLASDDSSYLWIGSTATSGYTTANALINNLYTGPAEKNATLSLTGGTYTPFRLQFGDGGGGEFITFSFAPPGRSRVYDGSGYFFCQTSRNPYYLISPSNLSVYLPFEATDVSGTSVANRASSTATAATLVNGASVSTADYKVGTASLSLTAASSQYATIPSFTPTTNGLTFSFWYRSNGSGTWARVFDFGNGANVYNVLISSNAINLNQLGFSVASSAGGINYYLTDINYNDNVWRHITWTLTYAAGDSFTSTWVVYVNGISKGTTTNYYPHTTVTRTVNYIGRSNWGADAYYNGYIDDFRIYDRVITATEAGALFSNTMYNYLLKNGSTTMVAQPQGLSPGNPATSGYAIFSANPWMADGTYWIKSSAMPNALQMYVDVKRGGFDYYAISGGTSVNAPSSTHSGTSLGLDLMVPRSQAHWRSIYQYVHTTLGSNYPTWLTALPIYHTGTSVGGNYVTYAMFDPRYGNSGRTGGSYNGAPDWTCKDGGLWYIQDVPFLEPNGDYTVNTFLGTYSEITYPQWLTSFGAPGFNDATSGYYYTGSNYLVSTNYAGSTLSTLYSYYDGSTAERAAPSALFIKNATGTSTNGVYWINLPTVGPTQIYCIMDSNVDGGGWMMTMKATRGTTFNYDSTYWTAVNTLNPSDTTRADADAKFHSMNYFPSKDLLALWPDIPSNYNNGGGGNLGNSIYINWANDSANNTLKIYTSTDSSRVDNTHLPASYQLLTGTYSYTATIRNDSNDYVVITLKDAANDSVITTIINGATPWATTSNLTGSFTLTKITRVYIHYNNNYYQYGTSATMNLTSSFGLSTWSWLKNNYNSGTKQTLINYFSTANNVSFGEPRGVERGTAFSSQVGNAFYGVNFTSFANMKVRWGFAWNNETDWITNDVIGGIGQYTNWGSLVSYSAGDQIGCCQDQTGINRSARVEMYVR